MAIVTIQAPSLASMLTDAGATAVEAANNNNRSLTLTSMQLGDSEVPESHIVRSTRTQLERRVWTGPLQSVSVDPDHPNRFLLEAVVPADQGGFTIREAAVLDSHNTIIAFANIAETKKPDPETVAETELTIQLSLEISPNAQVSLTLNPSFSPDDSDNDTDDSTTPMVPAPTPSSGPAAPTHSSPVIAASEISVRPPLELIGYMSQFQIASSAAGFTTPLHDSGEISSCANYRVPTNILERNTAYFWRARVKDNNSVWSPWSEPTSFTTTAATEGVIGVVLTQTGNGGQWQRVDGDFNAVTAESGDNFFNDHQVWGGIVKETIDGQAMVKIPKFYYRTGTVTQEESTTYVGKRFWSISGVSKTGFQLHPAFRADTGREVDYFHIASYIAGKTGVKATSVQGAPFESTANLPVAAANGRNVNGQTGWEFMTFYEWTALQWLVFLEAGQSDVQAIYGSGSAQNYLADAESAFVPAPRTAGNENHVRWRGVEALWGIGQTIPYSDSGSGGKIWSKDGSRTFVSTSETFVARLHNFIRTVLSDTNADYAFIPQNSGASTLEDSSFPDQAYYDPRYRSETIDGVNTHFIDVGMPHRSRSTVRQVGIFSAVSHGYASGGAYRRLIKRPTAIITKYTATTTEDGSLQEIFYDVPGTHQLTVPQGVSSISVVCVGGGGGGGASSAAADSNGGSSEVKLGATVLISAAGGNGGTRGSGGAGGQASGISISYNGGNGGDAGDSPSYNQSGHGGGAATASGPGQNGSHHDGNPSYQGGDGGAGALAPAPSTPAGGSGGAGGNGGGGGGGAIISGLDNGGGGGGAYEMRSIAVTPGSVLTVIVGDGGVGARNSRWAGGNGGQGYVQIT